MGNLMGNFAVGDVRDEGIFGSPLRSVSKSEIGRRHGESWDAVLRCVPTLLLNLMSKVG
jgi:hypothetical protein